MKWEKGMVEDGEKRGKSVCITDKWKNLASHSIEHPSNSHSFTSFLIHTSTQAYTIITIQSHTTHFHSHIHHITLISYTILP